MSWDTEGPFIMEGSAPSVTIPALFLYRVEGQILLDNPGLMVYMIYMNDSEYLHLQSTLIVAWQNLCFSFSIHGSCKIQPIS